MNTITVVSQTGSQIIPSIGSLLESLEKSGVTVESHCREGFCGACRIKKTKGEVEYFDNPIGYAGENEVLVCCSKAKTDIEIDIR
ncbi:class I ribonucleotide reductase maintenance protein YfaE [Colwellia sp. MSW7]|jgi:ferredoxin|uniref:Class I ribonucleotide reductase maintenance protein YfaE n=1 Tax=Colwellia maritima TaxID=2912588 RepID=A0ABS9X6W2_9GAMM|nr:class I ribonucleotide reductase maintenance protein YfaE [Colwellia maritima]MCI2285967.1 class I ribonucleotide reductase maintenance protein YfaE [Colwellia maritima]